MGDSEDLDNRARASGSRVKDSVSLDKAHGETSRELSIMLRKTLDRDREVKVGEDKAWAVKAWAYKDGEVKVWADKEWVDREWVDRDGEDSNQGDRAGDSNPEDRAGARVKVGKDGEVKAREVRAGEDKEARAGVQARKVSDDDDDKLKSL